MKKVTKDINVPESWDEVPYRNYLKLADTELNFTGEVESFDSLAIMVSILTETKLSDIRALKVKDYQSIINTMKFVNTAPERLSDSKWKIRSVNSLTYDEFVRYERMKKDPASLQIGTLSMMSGVSEEEILNLPVPEVLTGFFYLWKSARRSMDSLVISLSWKILRLQMKNWWTKMKKRLYVNLF